NAHKRTIRSICYEPTKGHQLASASFDGTTAIWEKDGSQDYECIATLEGHENEVKCVAWSHSGQLIASCGRDKSVWIWEVAGEGDFDCISVLMEHTQDVKQVIWHPTEEILASTSYDDTIRIWHEEDDDWYCFKTLEGHSSTVWSAAFSPDGKYLVSVSDDLTARLWRQGSSSSAPQGQLEYNPDAKSWACVYVLPPSIHKRPIYTVSWNSASAPSDSDLGLIATGGGDNILRIFAVTSSPPDSDEQYQQGDGTTDEKGLAVRLVEEFKNPHGLLDINCVAWNPNPQYSNWLATAGDDGIVRIWYYSP
ncbi:Cytosolic iron-sulfur protein assembly protein, partial [Spiromyces aspiralis]